MKNKPINEYSLAHTTWKCQYHIVFATKYRRKAIDGGLKKDIGKILRRLGERKNIEIIEAHVKDQLVYYSVNGNNRQYGGKCPLT